MIPQRLDAVQAWASEPAKVIERHARGVKYVVLGLAESRQVELTATDEKHAVALAQDWSVVLQGTAYCYCVQDGAIGGRPFYSVRRVV